MTQLEMRSTLRLSPWTLSQLESKEASVSDACNACIRLGELSLLDNRRGFDALPRLFGNQREVEEVPGGCPRRAVQQLHHFITVQERSIGAESLQFAPRSCAQCAVEPLGQRDVEALL